MQNSSDNFDPNYTYSDTTPINGTTFEPEPAPVLFNAFVCVTYGTVFMVALLGNGLVCFVVRTSPHLKKKVSHYFIMNLAVGDILMTVFCVPFSTFSVLILHYWPFGLIMCKMVNYSQAVSVMVSAYTMLTISIERYMAIMSLLQHRLSMSMKVAKIMMVAVWGGALATASPIPIVAQLDRPTDWHNESDVDACSEKWEHPEQRANYTWALLALQFVLPLGALVSTYTRIAFKVCCGLLPGESYPKRESQTKSSRRKMVKMMIVVVAVFTVCWMPLNIFNVLYTLYEEEMKHYSWLTNAWYVCHFLAMSHACYNPIIYCYMNKEYRRGFKKALRQLLCMKPSASSRSCRRSSGCDVALSEFGANGTSSRRTCNGACSCRRRRARSEAGARLQRGSTCTSCASSLRAQPAHAAAQPPHQPLYQAPAQALSVRQHYR